MSQEKTENPAFALSYTLHDHGWAEVSVGYGDAVHRQPVSYLHDSLKDLAKVAVALRSGKALNGMRALFVDEPGELALFFSSPKQSDTVQLRMEYTSGWFYSWGMTGSQPALWEGEWAREDLLAQIRAILADIYARYGEEAYRRRWIEHSFPMRLFRQLQP